MRASIVLPGCLLIGCVAAVAPACSTQFSPSNAPDSGQDAEGDGSPRLTLDGGDAAASSDAPREAGDGKATGSVACQRLAAACDPVQASGDSVRACVDLAIAGDEDACAAKASKCTSDCGYALCLRLSSFCHSPEHPTSETKECHALGHSLSAERCFANGPDCLAACEAAGAGPGAHDASAPQDAAPIQDAAHER